MNLKELYDASPLGMVSSLFYGAVQSALFLLLAVYAASMNFTILEISIVTFLLAIQVHYHNFLLVNFQIFMIEGKLLFIQLLVPHFLQFVQYLHLDKCICQMV